MAMQQGKDYIDFTKRGDLCGRDAQIKMDLDGRIMAAGELRFVTDGRSLFYSDPIWNPHGSKDYLSTE